MIKAIGFLGSARVGGNSELLLESVIKGIQKTGGESEIVRLSDLKIKPCLNCGGCDENGKCVQNDDMQMLYDKLLTYDLILIASPIYFMGLSAWTKMFIDRCQALWIRKYKLNKYPSKARHERKGVFLSVSGMRKPTAFQGADLTVKSFFATIHVTYIGSLFFPGIDQKGDIEKHPNALKNGTDLGVKLVNEFDNPDLVISIPAVEMKSEHTRE
jgi:multimeric flavodoxin WrbA